MTKEDKEFYMSLWATREHRCGACGCYLGNEPKSFMFDHLLEKNDRAYPQLRHTSENIFFVCLVCHTRKTNGFPMPKHQEAIDKMKEKYVST